MRSFYFLFRTVALFMICNFVTSRLMSGVWRLRNEMTHKVRMTEKGKQNRKIDFFGLASQ